MSEFAASVFDSMLYSPLFTQAQMKQIWSEENLVQCWLEFETAIAQVQAELGLIPSQAAAAIAAVCHKPALDWPRLARETRHVGMAIKPLIDQLSELGDDNVKKYLHWGCTTQDLLDSSLAMRVKQSLDLLREQLVSLAQQLAQMSDEHRHSVMVARTNAMDALPTTWGLQVSSYLQETTRHIERLDALYLRATTGLYGGAVGNLSSIGAQGLAVRAGLFKALGLNEPKGLGNASLDNISELVQFFALIHGSLCRIANDCETMGRAAIAEVREGEGGGGSSTMPHKANPRASNMIQTLSRMGWMYASGAPNLMDQHDVRSASMRMLNWSIVPEAALTLSASLERANGLIKHLIVDTRKMRDNFSHSREFILSEAVMMRVAEKFGRGEGYAAIKQAIAKAPASGNLREILQQDPRVSSMLSMAEIDDACDPLNYLGCNDLLIDETLDYFKQVVLKF